MFNNIIYSLILFSQQSDSEQKTSDSSVKNTTCDKLSQELIDENDDVYDKVDQFMYIQMEFCEKSTLRYLFFKYINTF